MPLIDKFHEDPDITVFLISTAAGGTGLNLTGANKVRQFDVTLPHSVDRILLNAQVVIFGIVSLLLFAEISLTYIRSCRSQLEYASTIMLWDVKLTKINSDPAHDLQAMDRAYRFGQTRDVHVYRLLGAGSLEELVYARQVYKQQQMRIGYEASVQTRYFGGVQNDAARQGELFGIKNIFKLHEEQLATKMAVRTHHSTLKGGLLISAQIEQAHVAELNWALENIASKKKKGEAGWVYEAEAAKSGIDVCD